jgi:type VI protein secretion system component Hcp
MATPAYTFATGEKPAAGAFTAESNPNLTHPEEVQLTFCRTTWPQKVASTSGADDWGVPVAG